MEYLLLAGINPNGKVLSSWVKEIFAPLTLYFRKRKKKEARKSPLKNMFRFLCMYNIFPSSSSSASCSWHQQLPLRDSSFFAMNISVRGGKSNADVNIALALSSLVWGAMQALPIFWLLCKKITFFIQIVPPPAFWKNSELKKRRKQRKKKENDSFLNSSLEMSIKGR